MFDLKGKVALVTGGRQGMGKAHSIALAKQGASVAVTDIDLTGCQSVVDAIVAQGGQAVAFELDVSNADQVDQVVAAVVKQWGQLDILVNNAGIYDPAMALDLTEERFMKTIRVNLLGEFLCARAAAKEMMKHKWGRIINIASVAAGQVGVGIAGGSHYSSSKGGILGLTETLAVEWAPHGITVNAIGPGAIDTPMAAGAKSSAAILKAFMAKIPLARMGTPEEVSAAVVFLASEEASYVTGATLFVDGGWLAA